MVEITERLWEYDVVEPGQAAQAHAGYHHR